MIITADGGTTIILPEPEFGDTVALASKAMVKYAMDGTRQTHVKTNSRYKIKYAFSLSYAKARELVDFFWAHLEEEVTWIDYEDVTWRGIFLSEPFEVEYNHSSRVEIELEGTK